MALSVLSRSVSGFELKHMVVGMDESATNFKFVSEDIIVNIFSRLEDDPRDLARLACACQRFLHVVRNVCWKRHCVRHVPELLPSPRVHLDAMAPPPGGWGGLMKLLVCCPGLKHAGVLLECWDFGLDRELGSSAHYNSHHHAGRRKGKRRIAGCPGEGSGEAKECHADVVLSCRSELNGTLGLAQQEVVISDKKVEGNSRAAVEIERCLETGEGSRFNSQYFGEKSRRVSLDELENVNLVAKSKQTQPSWRVDGVGPLGVDERGQASSRKRKEIFEDTTQEIAAMRELSPCFAFNFNSCEKSCTYTNKVKMQGSVRNSRKSDQQAGPLVTLNDRLRGMQASHYANACTEKASHEAEQHFVAREGAGHFQPLDMHLASGARNLSREQGNKLLASRFRADCLYICDWPGCKHAGEKRKYMLFRGIFKNFKASLVWRNLKDMKAKLIDVPCAFCNSASSWDMMTAFCLRRSFEYHDDGEPVVRAYVCENGHVSGAWTDRPLHTL